MQWVGTSKASYFAFHPHEFGDKNHYEKITLTRYCQIKNISKNQARKLIQKKWLAITRFRGQIWVHELCPDLINGFLN